MKVGILTGIYHPEQGGPATFLPRIRADLQQRGWDTVVITYGEVTSTPGIHRISRRWPVPLRLALYAVAVVRHARDADVWFVNDYGLVAAILAPVLGRPIVTKIVGDFAWESAVRRRLVPPPSPVELNGDPLIDFQQARHGPAVTFLKLVRTFGAKNARRVIVPSEYLRRIVLSWGVSSLRINVVPNGVDAKEFPNHMGTARPTVIAAARLVPWKGIDHLVHAFRGVLEDVRSAQLRIFGEGAERPALEAIVESLHFPPDAVVFEGHVPADLFRTALAEADVFVLPSAYEGLPHVVLEAFAAGCPVVATRAGGIPEVVQDGSDGILVSYGQPQQLRAALARLLTQVGMAREMGERGRQRVQSEFAWAQTSDKTIDVLRSATVSPST